jgi:hypothetical protein
LRFQATGIRLQELQDDSRWSKRCATRGEQKVLYWPMGVANADLIPEA